VKDSDLQPHLAGDLLELRPLRPEDWDDLFLVASDPMVWEQHPARDRYKEEVFKQFFTEALDSGGAFAVIDRKTQRIIGSSRYFGYEPANGEIEIGWTFLARSHWGGKYNREMKQLMLSHAFKFVDRVIFLIGPENHRSRRSVEKIGGVITTRRDKDKTDLLVYEIRKPAVP
jgi:RimJ/RimL family protein N-acetyltransferase